MKKIWNRIMTEMDEKTLRLLTQKIMTAKALKTVCRLTKVFLSYGFELPRGWMERYPP